jgi:hypothetical protein
MTTTHRPYRTDATQKEKAALLKNDERVRSGSTFLDHTHSEEGGRYAKPMNVIGSTPTAQYPAGPNWSVDPTGIEPPLGIDVNAVEAVGEYFELGDATPAVVAQGDATTEGTVVGQSQSASSAGADERPIVSDPSDDVEPPPAPASPNPKPKRGE